MLPCARSRSVEGWAVALAACAGCATASPTLVPARTLPVGRIALDVGSAYSAPVHAPALTGAQASGADDQTLYQAAAMYGATPPGVAPYVSGRAGFARGADASIALIGRTVRLGARKELLHGENLTLTGGLAGRFAPLAGPQNALASRLALDDSRLYGGDLSLVFGYTRRDTYDLWLGLRGSYLYTDMSGSITRADAPGVMSPFTLGAHRVEAGATLGLRVGFGHFGAAVEIEAVMAWVGGTANVAGAQADASGVVFSLVPAGAVSYAF